MVATAVPIPTPCAPAAISESQSADKIAAASPTPARCHSRAPLTLAVTRAIGLSRFPPRGFRRVRAPLKPARAAAIDRRKAPVSGSPESAAHSRCSASGLVGWPASMRSTAARLVRIRSASASCSAPKPIGGGDQAAELNARSAAIARSVAAIRRCPRRSAAFPSHGCTSQVAGPPVNCLAPRLPECGYAMQAFLGIRRG